MICCTAAAGMKVKQTVDKMATVADSLSEGGVYRMRTVVVSRTSTVFVFCQIYLLHHVPSVL